MKKTFLIIFIGLMVLFAVPRNLNAASATFKTTASTSRIVVGKTFTATVRVSSSEKLGSWEYTISYNSSVLSLVSGPNSVADPGNGSQTSATYNYTFKAIKSGTSSISVKSYGAISWNEATLSSGASGTSVTVITQAQLEASYSKDNNLKALSIDGATLTPTFNSNTTAYTASLDPSTTSIKINATPNDSRSNVSGDGTFDVIEGENKFEIKVTAENNSTKTYTITANVIDPNPITVKTDDNEELTVVKRKSSLTAPKDYTETTVTIDDQQIPALTNETTKLTLVGLKNTEGVISLYVFKNKTYTKYNELKLKELTLLPSDIENSNLLSGYKKFSETINSEKVEVFKYSKSSEFAIIYAMNTETGKYNYYMYDLKNNTAILYNSELSKSLEKKLNIYEKIIFGLLIESGICFIFLIILLSKNIKRNKMQSDKIKEKKEKLIIKKEIIQEEPTIEEAKEEMQTETPTEEEKSKVEEVKEKKKKKGKK